MIKNKKNFVILIGIILIIILTVIYIVMRILNSKNNSKIAGENNDVNIYDQTEDVSTVIPDDNNDDIIDKKIDIIDVNSNSRPYAVVINNTPVAVKVQEGLNRAYIVYEVPTEGNTSRLIALYKDIPDNLVIGTIRSARHNFIDFALESDAIFCCFGWSFYAERDLKNGVIDYLQGLYGDPYYRHNPENLPTEHTAYTTAFGLANKAKENGFRTTTQNTSLLNYSYDDVDLSLASNKSDAKNIVIEYGQLPNVTKFVYNEDKKIYTRFENNIPCVDHCTKEEVTAKNIIVQKISYGMSDNNYYLDLHTTGVGEGYYITCGYCIPITWSKQSRGEKTKFTYKQGTVINNEDVGGREISVSDGNTYIEVQTLDKGLSIN